LVCPEEADITQLRVSVVNPIKVALLGLVKGVSFKWDTRENQQHMPTHDRPALLANAAYLSTISLRA
jgi:hypothetical protein